MQSNEKGQCLPVTVRNHCPQSFTFVAAAVRARHVGLRPGFVDEVQTGGIYIDLISLPELTLTRNVRPILLAGQHAFFEADPDGLEKARQHSRVGLNVTLVAQSDRQDREGDIRFGINDGPQPGLFRPGFRGTMPARASAAPIPDA